MELPGVYADIERVLSAAGYPGREIALVLARELGGEPRYFPLLATAQRPRRDRDICREFTGNNYRELAKKHGLTEIRIRQIVARGPRGHGTREMQGELPL